MLPKVTDAIPIGRKYIFLLAIAELSISDLLCSFSVNSTMLYVSRGFAGMANGGVTSLAMMIVSDSVSLRQRGKYQGILGASVGAGNMVGSFIAAAFVQHSTWRGLFWVVSPAAAVCGLVSFFMLPNNALKTSFRESVKKIDYLGLFTGSSAILLILIPVSGGGTYFQWDSVMVITMLVLGAVCAVAFFFVEYKVALLPMMPCKYIVHINFWMTIDRIRSIHVQEPSSLHSAPAELPLRRSLLLSALLPPSLLPKRPAALPYRLRRSRPPHSAFSNDLFHILGLVHIPLRALRRRHLGRVLPLDASSSIDLHFHAGHASRRHSHHPEHPGRGRGFRVPAYARRAAGALHQGASSRHHQ